MNIDYESLRNETNIKTLHAAIQELNRRLYECQEEISRAWVYARTKKTEKGEFGWSGETGELAGCYDIIADQIIEEINNKIQ